METQIPEAGTAEDLTSAARKPSIGLMRFGRRLCATVRFIAVLTLINMFPAVAGKPEPDMNGWDPFMDTIGCGHKEGVAWSGHTAGTPNGFCGETYEYAYGCNKVTKC